MANRNFNKKLAIALGVLGAGNVLTPAISAMENGQYNLSMKLDAQLENVKNLNLDGVGREGWDKVFSKINDLRFALNEYKENGSLSNDQKDNLQQVIEKVGKWAIDQNYCLGNDGCIHAVPRAAYVSPDMIISMLNGFLEDAGFSIEDKVALEQDFNKAMNDSRYSRWSKWDPENDPRQDLKFNYNS